ncbi:hypothetical protein Btru_044287 [Bulinus truncatus]|nr:hypothetical protein Btru_044287 [Bulinus truncatus]
MSANERQLKLIRLKLEMVQEERRQLEEAVDSYMNNIVKNADIFLDTQGISNFTFKDLSRDMENAIILLGDAVALFKSKPGYDLPRQQSFGETIIETDGMYESSGSMSFEVLQQTPCTVQFGVPQQSYLKSVADAYKGTQLLDHQMKACNSKIESLSNTLVRVISDLSSLKKQESLESSKEMPKENFSLEDSEKFVEMKKKYQALSEELEAVCKQIDRVNKELAAHKTESKEKFSLFEGRLNNAEAKFLHLDADLKNKVVCLEKDWTKFEINTKTLEHRLNQSENSFNNIDHRLMQLQDKTGLVIEEKEKEITTMSNEMTKISQEVLALKEEGSGKTEKSLKDMSLTIKALEIWVKEDLQHKVIELEQPVKKLEDLKIDKALEEQKSLLTDILTSQDSLVSRVQTIEKRVKPRVMPLYQQVSQMRIGTRVKRGPNWSQVFHGAQNNPPPCLGTIILYIPAYKKFQVRWDNGQDDFHIVNPEENYYEIQLASPPEID